mmetsp:Transcript_16811/g.48844  ORF Transcript_16811/g.48844 Transcript_16811/m.48844 type:complete len:251 (-) Transcript_16811:1050-1802(-)
MPQRAGGQLRPLRALRAVQIPAGPRSLRGRRVDGGADDRLCVDRRSRLLSGLSEARRPAERLPLPALPLLPLLLRLPPDDQRAAARHRGYLPGGVARHRHDAGAPSPQGPRAADSRDLRRHWPLPPRGRASAEQALDRHSRQLTQVGGTLPRRQPPRRAGGLVHGLDRDQLAEDVAACCGARLHPVGAPRTRDAPRVFLGHLRGADARRAADTRVVLRRRAHSRIDVRTLLALALEVHGGLGLGRPLAPI